MKQYAPVLAAIGVAASLGVAHADPYTGFYGALGAGVPIPSDQTMSGAPAGLRAPKVEFDTGVAASVAAGYSLGNGLRLEGEYSYIEANVDKVGGQGSGGKFMSNFLFGNVLYDIDGLGWQINNAAIVPHIGGGIGWSNPHVRGTLTPAGYVSGSAGASSQLAYQAIVGFEIPATHGLKIGADYRFVATDDLHRSAGGGTYGYPMHIHSVMFTVRWNFDEETTQVTETQAAAPPPPPPPPAPAAPAPEPQRAFQVFFDFDKSMITADAARIIQQAAETVKAGHIAHIEVVGHTDTVGSVAYNQKLSERRAAAVKKQLQADGVGADAIVTRGVGKSDLLVPTPDGVREPQNRRAEIHLQ